MSATKPKINSTSSDKHTLPSAIDAYMHGVKINWDSLLPARVISYDRGSNLAIIQPMVQWVLTDDSARSRGQLVQIPVLSMGAGGFHISFPIVPNDLGWIWASDRDLSLFKQSLAEAPPPIARMHSFEDGMFIPDVFRKYTIADEDSGAMVIQSTDSQTKISIRGDNILIAAPTKVLVRTPLTEFSKDVQIDGNLTVKLNTTVIGNTTVTGNTTVNGGFDATGSESSGANVNLPSITKVNGKQIDGHDHSGVQRGGGDTDPF